MKKNSNYSEYLRRFTTLFDQKSDEELIRVFNGRVGLRCWGLSQAAYVHAWHNAIERREIDISNIYDGESTSYKYAVILKGKKVYRLLDLKPHEVLSIILTYIHSKLGIEYDFRQDIRWNNDEVDFWHPEFHTLISFNANELFKDKTMRYEF